jgi:hypothetical protein
MENRLMNVTHLSKRFFRSFDLSLHDWLSIFAKSTNKAPVRPKNCFISGSGPKMLLKSLCPKMGNDQVADLPTAGEPSEGVGLIMQRDILLQVTLHDTRLYKTQMQY